MSISLDQMFSRAVNCEEEEDPGGDLVRQLNEAQRRSELEQSQGPGPIPYMPREAFIAAMQQHRLSSDWVATGQSTQEMVKQAFVGNEKYVCTTPLSELRRSECFTLSIVCFALGFDNLPRGRLSFEHESPSGTQGELRSSALRAFGCSSSSIVRDNIYCVALSYHLVSQRSDHELQMVGLMTG